MKRNKPIKIVSGDTVICIKSIFKFKQGKKYVVTNTTDNFIIVNIIYFEKINKLHKMYSEIKNTIYNDVKKVLKNILPDIEEKVYFEDIFSTLKIERKRKLEKLKKINKKL